MASASATLGGYFLLNSSPVKWTMREGVRPSVETFDMRPADATALLNAYAGKPCTLVMSVNGATVTVRNLYVLHVAPQDKPQIAKVTVADRRWLWPSTHILRRYNMRRNIGSKRIVNIVANGSGGSLDQNLPAIQYWPWSLKVGKDATAIPWRSKDVLADVMAEIAQVEQGWNGNVMPFVDSTGAGTSQTPIENLELNDSGDGALARVLNYLPGVGIKVELDGTARAYNKTDGTEGESVSNLGPEVVGGGHVVLVNNAVLRPRRILVQFQREIERRFDFEENTTGSVAQNGPDSWTMENVGQVTDPFLTISGKAYPEGTWLTISEICTGFSQRAGFTVDRDLLRQAMVPFFDLWADLNLTGQFDPSADWVPRIAMLQRCYRQYFRINARNMARILALRPYRISTVDQATGTRAPAAVYADHAIIPSMRGKLANGVDNQYFALNVTAYPPSGVIDSTTRPAPALVEIVDQDQGIIAINYKVDPLRLNEMVLPSKIVNNPRGDIRFPLAGPVSFDSVVDGQDPPALSPSFKCAVILTCVPASPNGDAQLHEVPVLPAQVEPLLGRSVGTCLGPDLEIYVGPNVLTAKIRWQDSRAADIEACFGLPEGKNAIPNLQGLVLNDGQSGVEQGASLQNVALAVAAQVYAALLDRQQGTQAGILNPNVGIKGYVEEVSHEITPRGAGLTHVSLPGQVPRLTLATFLDSNTRAALFKIAMPQAVA